MLANPFGMNRMIDPRVAMQLMEEAKRNQMMMLSPYDMMDPVRLQVQYSNLPLDTVVYTLSNHISRGLLDDATQHVSRTRFDI